MKTIIDLIEYFDSERKCSEYIAEQRWGSQPECPYCKSDVYKFKDGIRYKCKSCGVFNVKTGTAMEGSKVSLKKWIIAIYLHTSDKKGVSSYQLAKQIGVTQKTAWFMLSRLRHAYAFENDPSEELRGVVECDETFVGGKNRNRHTNKKYEKANGRAFKDKTPIIGMLQRGGKVKTVVMPNTEAQYITPIIQDTVHEDAIIMTDEWRGYKEIGEQYRRVIINHAGNYYGDTLNHTNGIENFWNYIKRMIVGVYHNVSKKHLQKYANEATFRFNTRHMGDMERLAHAFTCPYGKLPYKRLIAA